MHRKNWANRLRKGQGKGMDEEEQGPTGSYHHSQQQHQRTPSFWDFPSIRQFFRGSAPVNPSTPEIIVTTCSSETIVSSTGNLPPLTNPSVPISFSKSLSASTSSLIEETPLQEIKEDEVATFLEKGNHPPTQYQYHPSELTQSEQDYLLLDLPTSSEDTSSSRSRRLDSEQVIGSNNGSNFNPISTKAVESRSRRNSHERRKSEGGSATGTLGEILMNPSLLLEGKKSLGNTLRLPKTFRKRSRSYCDLRLSSSPRRRMGSDPHVVPELTPTELKLILIKNLKKPKKTERNSEERGSVKGGKKDREERYISQLNEILNIVDGRQESCEDGGSSATYKKGKSSSDDNIIDHSRSSGRSSFVSSSPMSKKTSATAVAGLGAISTGLLPAASVASLLDNRFLGMGSNNLRLPNKNEKVNGGVGGDQVQIGDIILGRSPSGHLVLDNATLPRIRSRPRLLSHPEFSLPDSIQTAPAASAAKRFFIPPYFRRPSQMSTQGLPLTESMVSLTNRALVSFINDDNYSGLQHLLDNRRVVVDDRDEAGCSALMIAASKGKANFVRLLLEHGADINSEDADNWTALHFASKEGHDEIVADLLDHGAVVDKLEMGGWTPLMWACYKGRTKAARLLIEKNADVNAYGNFHVSCLAWASGRGHTEIVKELLLHGSRINSGDKYGTTPLIWASRKGYIEIVDALLSYEANVDACGMTSWTPLLVATAGNHVEVVKALLEHKPNINALDKDGCSALTIACKEGFHEIAICLINHGAYININDRGGTSNLIHAAKGGHRSIVESLLKKHADVNFQGKDRKTALYWAVEKSHVNVVKLLLSTNPDLELSTKDGDSTLMKAVRNRNAEIVTLLLEKRAKVGTADKNGDTCLHIAMRARSKNIVELILRNPINSQLLYRPNRAGETPYNIDRAAPKPIMTQIFGSRGLNTQEDGENLLGYNLYSSALADMLSDPTLNTPITVGLFARWGSGKSFLLSKLREEMKNFARQWLNPSFSYDFLIFLIIVCIAAMLGVIGGLASQSWIVGVSFGGGFALIVHILLLIIWFSSRRSKYEYSFSNKVSSALARRMESLRGICQVIFCHPPGSQSSDQMQAQPINFYFTEQTKISTTTGGENSVVQMLGSLYTCIENDYGVMSTRLYRAFRPRPVNATSGWKWRKLCCIPYFVIFLMCFACTLVWIVVLTMYLTSMGTEAEMYSSTKLTLQIIFYTCALTVGMFLVANMYTMGRVVKAVVLSHRRHLQRTVSKLDAVKAEGFLQALKAEVNLMTNMVKCLDAFNGKQSRLVVIVDGLDSGEQEKVLQVLDAVHILFSDAKAPFIILLAVDPHIIAKGIELNINPVLNESNIGGHDYLRNLVHLPFFLQNAALRKVKHVKMLESTIKRSSRLLDDDSGPGLMLSARRPSVESTGFQLQLDRFDKPSIKKNKKLGLKMSESIASSLGSNLNRVTSNVNMPGMQHGPSDLKKMLLGDDYFSDVNPRSMRRLMNIIHITGRLLKSFSIDFNWYHLSAWVNVTEQWPYRLSWMIIYCEQFQKDLEDSTSLKAVYEKVRPFVPTSKEVDPNVILDRDEKKLDVYLGLHKGSLIVSTLYVFLPFTISLDPQLRKDITEQYQPIDQIFKMNPPTVMAPPPPVAAPPATSPFLQTLANSNAQQLRLRNSGRFNVSQHSPPINPWNGMGFGQSFYPGMGYNNGSFWNSNGQTPFGGGFLPPLMQQAPPILEAVNIDNALIKEFKHRKLSSMNVEAVCDLLVTLTGIKSSQVTIYQEAVRKNNICGRVLMSCEMADLKLVLQMTFGDWELFKSAVVVLREVDKGNLHLSSTPAEENVTNNNVPAASCSTTASTAVATSSGGKLPRNSSGKDIRISVTSPTSASPSEKSTTKSQNIPSSAESQYHENASRKSSQPTQLVRPNVLEKQVTMEEQMICGALELLNEEAKEDALKGEESPTSTLSPINSEPELYPDVRKSSKAYLAQDETDVLYVHGSFRQVTAELPDSPSIVRKLEEAEPRYAVVNETASHHQPHQNYATVLRNVSSTSAISEELSNPSSSGAGNNGVGGYSSSQVGRPGSLTQNFSFSGSTMASVAYPGKTSSTKGGKEHKSKGKDSPRKSSKKFMSQQQQSRNQPGESSSDASSDESQKPLVMKPLGADAKQPRKGLTHRPPKGDGEGRKRSSSMSIKEESSSKGSRFSKLKSSLFGGSSSSNKDQQQRASIDSSSSASLSLIPTPGLQSHSKGKPPVRYDLPAEHDSSEASQYFKDHGYEWKAARGPTPIPPFETSECFDSSKASHPSPTTSNESELGSTSGHLCSKEMYFSETPDFPDSTMTVVARPNYTRATVPMEQFSPSSSSPLTVKPINVSNILPETNTVPIKEVLTSPSTQTTSQSHYSPHHILPHVIENPLSTFVPSIEPQAVFPRQQSSEEKVSNPIQSFSASTEAVGATSSTFFNKSLSSSKVKHSHSYLTKPQKLRERAATSSREDAIFVPLTTSRKAALNQSDPGLATPLNTLMDLGTPMVTFRQEDSTAAVYQSSSSSALSYPQEVTTQSVNTPSIPTNEENISYSIGDSPTLMRQSALDPGSSRENTPQK